jgi:hypothetical protein
MLSPSVSVSPRPQGCALHFKQFSYRRKAVGSATPVVMRLGYAPGTTSGGDRFSPLSRSSAGGVAARTASTPRSRDDCVQPRRQVRPSCLQTIIFSPDSVPCASPKHTTTSVTDTLLSGDSTTNDARRLRVTSTSIRD